MYEKERKKILELLSNNIIDTDTAETLLNALDNTELGKSELVVNPNEETKTFKQLEIRVLSDDGDDVNIKIPLEFAKLLKTKSFGSEFADANIDIDGILELASSGMVGDIIDIKSSDGDVVKVRIV